MVALVLMASVGVLSAAEPTRWINVDVDAVEEGASVKVRLPLSLVLSVLNAVDTEGFRNGMVDMRVHDTEVDWVALFDAVKTAPDGEFVRVQADDANVLVTKMGGSIVVNVEEHSEQARVEVNVPAELIDAISIDDNNQLDIAALLTRLGEVQIDDLVRVESPDANVRVWID
jgi:hypothetical protein